MVLVESSEGLEEEQRAFGAEAERADLDLADGPFNPSRAHLLSSEIALEIVDSSLCA